MLGVSVSLTRQQANIQIARELVLLIELYPDMRFSQILLNYGFVKQERPTSEFRTSWQNEYHVEPSVILDRIHKTQGEL